MFRQFMLSFCALAVFFVSGCTDSAVEVASGTAIALANTHCPIMGGEVSAADIDPSLVKDWNGKKIGFCCPPCLEEWDELTDAEKAEKLAHPGESHSHGDAGHGDAGQTANNASEGSSPAADAAAPAASEAKSETSEPAPAGTP